MSAVFEARRSHLIRCGVGDWTEFHDLAHRHRPAPDQEMTALTLENAPYQLSDGATLDRLLRTEYAALLTRHAPEDEIIESDWQVKLVRPPHLGDGLELDASISRTRSGSHHLELSLGLCYALDDAILTALSIWGFYTDRTQKNDKPDPFAVINRGGASEGRYYSYAGAAKADPAELSAILTYCTPLDAMKLAQSDLLLSLAMRWIELHEDAHLLLGHLDWWLAHRQDETLGLAESAMFIDGMEDAGSADSYCLELQADAFATQMLITLGLSDAMQNATAVRTYAAARQAAEGARNAFAPVLSDRLSMFRSLVLAAALSSLIFEVRRQKRARRSFTHPPPSTRILNICTTALASYGDILRFEQGDHAPGAPDEYATAMMRPAITATMTCMVEFEMMAGVLGVDDAIYRSELLGAKDRVLAPNLASPLSDDFFSLMHPGRRRGNDLKTDGGKAFVALLDRSKEIQDELSHYSRIGAFRGGD